MSQTSDPIPALNALADHLLGVLGIRRFAHLPQHGYRAPSYAASLAFDKGMELFAVKGDGRRAIPFLKQAIALDSTFARAYLVLEQQYINRGELDRADSVVQPIEQFPQRLTEAERLQLAFHKMEKTGDIPAQLEVLQRLVTLDSSALWLELSGGVANDLLRPDLAVPAIEAGRETYALIGGYTLRGMFDNLLEAYHQAGMHDRELRLAIDLPAKYPVLGSATAPRLRAYAGLARPKPALALADTMLREANDSSFVALVSVGMAAEEFRAHGDTATATTLLGVARKWIATNPARTPYRQLVEGSIFLSSGMADSALVHFSATARSLSDVEVAGYLAVAQAKAGDRIHAQAIADSLGRLSFRGLNGEHTFWQAAIAAALGDRETAARLLQKARDGGQSMRTWHYNDALVSLHGYPAFEALIRPKR
jgi:tetratricopeptide (TPR) repeat protein